jgi:SpoVK/Ycf46/Vps4 family AAA+-type ATPase
VRRAGSTRLLAEVHETIDALGSRDVRLDEADALLGQRSKVRDAHDRYASAEVAHLLQRLEEHKGPGILATRLKDNIDPAFIRRLRYLVEFPRPR